MTDWSRVRERLKTAQEALDRALEPDQERLEGVYRQRASDLAERSGQRQAHAVLSALVCRVGGERYAVELRHLAEVRMAENWVRVPGAPAEILGAINVRGDIRLLADMAALLGMPQTATARAATAGTPVLMLRRPEVGLAVDHVEQLARLPAEALLPATESGSHFVQWVTNDGLRILSVETLLTHPILGGKR